MSCVRFTEEDFGVWNIKTSVVSIPAKIVGKDKATVVQNDFISAIGAKNIVGCQILPLMQLRVQFKTGQLQYQRRWFPWCTSYHGGSIRNDKVSFGGGCTLPISQWALPGAIGIAREDNPGKTPTSKGFPPYSIWDTHGFHVSKNAHSNFCDNCWFPVQSLVKRPANILLCLWSDWTHAIGVSHSC